MTAYRNWTHMGWKLAAGIGLAVALAGAAAAQEIPERVVQPDETAEGFNLEALIEAAKKEPPITIYSQTGKVIGEAERFSAKYGLQATGVKVELGAIDKVAREADAGNVIGDVLVNSELSGLVLELLATGKVTSWVPGDMADKIKPEYQYPLQLHFGHWGWIYNTEVYDKCPIDNIWQFTEEEYKGRFAIADPLSNALYPAWFNMLAKHDDETVKALYKERYGEDLVTDEPSAVHEWLKRLAANSPKVTRTDEEVSEAIGAPGQKAPAFGLTSMAKFRNNKGKGYKLGLCDTLRPWALQAFPSAIVIAKGTDSINAAKLFVHYMFTEEGFAEELGDGKVSSNSDMPLPKDPSNVAMYLDKASPYRPEDIISNFETRQEWDDLWLQNYQ